MQLMQGWESLMNSSAIEANDVIDTAAEDEVNDWEPNATSSLVEFWMSSDLPPKGELDCADEPSSY